MPFQYSNRLKNNTYYRFINLRARETGGLWINLDNFVCELNLSSLVTYHGEKTTSTRRILDMIDAKRTAGQILGEPFRGKKQGNNFNLAIYDRKPSP